MLQRILLNNFRSYEFSSFEFSPRTTVIIGKNTAGKTNIIEAIHLLSTGKSFRAEKDVQMIRFGQEIGRVQGLISVQRVKEEKEGLPQNAKLEVMLATGNATGGRFSKKYLLEGAPKNRIDFAGHVAAVLFSPEEMELVTGSPSLRRNFMDAVLELTDRHYRNAALLYEKALKQRNALLHVAKETGRRNSEQFSYWDNLLITHGQLITKKREEFLEFINSADKNIFSFKAVYNKSVISSERLAQYEHAEVASGVTLVGPHRDDVLFHMTANTHDSRYFASRGQQRMIVLQIKLLQLNYVFDTIGVRPLLLLDDVFSELDIRNAELVLQMVRDQQTIITTATRDLLENGKLENIHVIELENG